MAAFHTLAGTIMIGFSDSSADDPSAALPRNVRAHECNAALAFVEQVLEREHGGK